MNFIIERQERFAGQQTHQQMLVDTLLESQNTLTKSVTQIVQAHNARLNRQDARDDKQDTRLDALTDSLNSLTRTVDRYISARTNGTSGNGQK